MTGTDTTPVGGDAVSPEAAATAAPRGVTRRGILGLLGAGALGGGLVGSAAGVMADRAFAGARQAAGGSTYAFHGPHQAGITTSATSTAPASSRSSGTGARRPRA
jgi:deferrochelatase/peroxidase EfeB